MPGILGRWYTQKRNLTLKQVDSGSVCFCLNETVEAVVDCSNTLCSVTSYHLSFCKLTYCQTNGCALCVINVHQQESQQGQMVPLRKLLTYTQLSVYAKKSRNLKDHQFNLIIIPNGWLKDDSILEVQPSGRLILLCKDYRIQY